MAKKYVYAEELDVIRDILRVDVLAKDVDKALEKYAAYDDHALEIMFNDTDDDEIAYAIAGRRVLSREYERR